jgi:hypothetical protein
LRNDIHNITQKHETEIGKLTIDLNNIKKVLNDKKIKFKSQLRASDYRHREVVRSLHNKERAIVELKEEVKKMKLELHKDTVNIQTFENTIELERKYSNHLLSILIMLRAEILSMHVNNGTGADKKLQRTTFKLARSDKLRIEQLNNQLDEKVDGSGKNGSVTENSVGLKHSSDVSHNQHVLIESMKRLITNIKMKEKNNLNLLWDRERSRYSDHIRSLELKNGKLKEVLLVEKEKSDYALSLVKAVKPLIQNHVQ